MGVHSVQILPRPIRITLNLVRQRKLNRRVKPRLSSRLVVVMEAAGVAVDAAVPRAQQNQEENEERCEQQHQNQHHHLTAGREVPVLRQRELSLLGTAVGGREVRCEGTEGSHIGGGGVGGFEGFVGQARGGYRSRIGVVFRSCLDVPS